MVDRESRDQFAQAVRHLAAGLITTDRFETKIPEDIAIWEIWQAGVSPFYHDLWPYRLRGRHRLDAAGRSVMVRCIAFLYSDGEYIWPPHPTRYRDVSAWEQLIDWEIWPFRSRDALEATRRRPRLLAGTA